MSTQQKCVDAYINKKLESTIIKLYLQKFGMSIIRQAKPYRIFYKEKQLPDIEKNNYQYHFI
jgi:hypothetical protein